MFSIRHILSGVLCLAFTGWVSHASVVVDFNDLSAAQLQGQAGGTGLTGNWAGVTPNLVVSGDLSGPAASSSLIYAQTGTAQKFQAGDNTYPNVQNYISLASPFTGVTWVSFVANVTGNYRLGLGINATGTSRDAGTDMQLFLNGNNTNPEILQVLANGGQVKSATVTGTDFFIVARLDPTVDANNVDIWINPTSVAAFDGAPAIADASIDFTGNVISSFGVGGYSTASEMDNIRFGTELQDVANVIPEPGTLSLLFSGAFLIWIWRRLHPVSGS